VPEPVDEAFSARITLRLPESLKQRVESAAARDGASVNTWLVQALQRSVEPPRSMSGSRNRLTGYGRS
jgi:predicted HicB family RNase H-like nuclease